MVLTPEAPNGIEKYMGTSRAAKDFLLHDPAERAFIHQREIVAERDRLEEERRIRRAAGLSTNFSLLPW